MNLTSRSRYALKIMIDLAQRDPAHLVKRQDIVARQGIPEKYLDQIMIRLRRSGLVKSIRGRLGGYSLGRLPHEIALWEIFHAVEDCIYPVMCLDEHNEPCFYKTSCITHEPWHLIFEAMRKPLQDTSLATVISRIEGKSFRAANGVQECPPGRAVAPDNDEFVARSSLSH